MKRAIRLVILAMGVLVTAASWGAAQSIPPRTPVGTTAFFRFYSDFGTNLNDALIEAGRARRAKRPVLFESGIEQPCFDSLPPAERAGWRAALEYYAAVVSPGSHSGREQTFLRLDLAGIAKPTDWKNADDRRFIEVSAGIRRAATAAYERCRWPAQDAANRRWIEEVTPRLVAHEAALGRRLVEVYQTPWVNTPYAVDVVETFSFEGANAIGLIPPGLHVLASRVAPANQGAGALEILFHEASHFLTADGTPLRQAIDVAVSRIGTSYRGNILHGVHFYLTGEVVRRALEDAGEPPFVPSVYAQRVYPEAFLDAAARAWRPYLDGTRTLRDAAVDLIQALGGRAN